MSNLWINWRVWRWHLQVVRYYDLLPYLRAGLSPIRLSLNRYHPAPWWPPVSIYEGRGAFALLLVLVAIAWWAL